MYIKNISNNFVYITFFLYHFIKRILIQQQVIKKLKNIKQIYDTNMKVITKP